MSTRTWLAIGLGAAAAAVCAVLVSRALGWKVAPAFSGALGGAVGAVVTLQVAQHRGARRG